MPESSPSNGPQPNGRFPWEVLVLFVPLPIFRLPWYIWLAALIAAIVWVAAVRHPGKPA